MNVNLNSLFILTQAVGRHMIERRHGKIINIASLLSFQGGILVPAYTASKHAVAGLTKSFANEWAAYNVQVNAIAPGYITTNNTKQIREDKNRNTEILKRIPAERWGEPADIMRRGGIPFISCFRLCERTCFGCRRRMAREIKRIYEGCRNFGSLQARQIKTMVLRSP